MEYKNVYKSESIGQYGSFGIILQFAFNGELDDAAKGIMDTHMSNLRNAFAENLIRNNESLIEQAKIERENLISLFPDSIYVENVANEYSNGAYGELFNWLKVTTSVGHIKIGWRKRVINIDWSDTIVKATGEELFPEEDVTKGTKYSDNKQYIHAWGLDKAKEYINKILTWKTL